jgi:putative ABC transport system ATP-binding protein
MEKVRSCKNHREENKIMAKSIIHIEQIERHFQMGDEVVKALRKVDLSIAEGEFITIMGSSGSGKSTLLNIVGCLDSPSHGTYQLDGLNVGDLNKNELAEIRNKKIGFIFQSYNLLARTSALENVELPLLYNSSVSNTERRERAKEALKSVGLLDRMHHTPSELSGGQQQRVAIARALVNDPVVILADEATGNLDTKTSYEIMALFQELNEAGKTIVFVTHEPDIAQFSSRTVVLKDGRIIKDNQVTNRHVAKDILLNFKEEE